MRIAWQTVRRITNEILGKKGLNSNCKIHILYIDYSFHSGITTSDFEVIILYDV